MPEALGELLVVISPHVPFQGIPHAGGQFLDAHTREVAFERVVVVAPATVVNREAVAQATVETRLVPFAEAGLRGNWRRFVRAIQPWVMSGGFSRQLHTDEVSALLSRATAIEIHWPEAMSLVTAVKAQSAAPVIFYPHDILSQRISRERRGGGLIRRSRARLIVRRVLRAESRLFPVFDSLAVFSHKDADLARGGGAARVHVIPPPLAPASDLQPTGRVERSRRLLFSAAFDRRVNDDAALWLLREIWPIVQRTDRTIELVLAGNAPSDELVSLAGRLPRVLVTGRVPSLHLWFDSAQVFIAPLLEGAGLKFKCVDAALMGLSLIGTPVAAEGLPSAWFGCISEDPRELANAVLSAFATWPADTEHRESVRKEANRLYSFESYVQECQALYLGLVRSQREEGR